MYSTEAVVEDFWNPATREGSSMITVGQKVFMLGGLNHEISKEVASMLFTGLRW